MVRKETPVQLEIFSDTSHPKTQEKPKSFFSCIWSYEKAILLIIAFLVVGVVAFSLGFERGKKTNTAANQNNAVQQRTEVLPVKQKVIKDSEPGELTTPRENYTIQVATYKSKTSAQKEIQLLKNKGFQPMVFSKDDRLQLCVGQFVKKEEAQASLKELKKRYEDCFIRRL